jgi:hypothetical protein
MSNLRLINETTATSVSSVDITDVFSADFDIYKIEIEADDYNANSLLTLRLINSSGSVISSTDYANAIQYQRTDTTFSELRSTADTVLFERVLGFFSYNSGSRQGGAGTVYIFNPSNTSSYTFALAQASSDLQTGRFGGVKGIGVLKQTSSITGFQLTQDIYTATYGEIKAKVYGLRVDS